MTRSISIRTALAAAILCSSWTAPAYSLSIASEAIYGVITIYNKTNIQLDYQIRARRNGKWSDWENQHHSHPRGGWHYHYYNNEPEVIQIRFDRIGGDDAFTEQVYDLDSNMVIEGERMCRHKGRAYKFEFDRGGRLLDLYHCRSTRR